MREGAINSLTNPKSLLFMFAFLTQFVDPTAGPVWTQLLLGTLQKLAGVLSLGSVAMASGTVGVWLTRWPRLLAWQERFTGMVMIGWACAYSCLATRVRLRLFAHSPFLGSADFRPRRWPTAGAA